MRINYGLLIGALTLLGASVVRADSLQPADPRIFVGGVKAATEPFDGSGDAPTKITLVTLGTLPFKVPVKGGGGASEFSNATGESWTGITFTGSSKNPQNVTCDDTSVGTLFQSCSVTYSTLSGNPPNGKFEVTIVFANGLITPGEDFVVDLNPGPGQKAWQSPFLDAEPTFAAVPEPSVLTFLAGGLGLFPLLKLRRTS